MVWTQKRVLSGQGCTMAFDSTTGRALAFSGLGETYEWNGNQWSALTPATAFDRKRNTLVMFGGDAGTALLDDTWEWNGSDWRRASPTVRPAGRVGHASAYDTTRNTVVIQGGVGPAGPLFDTWEWDGAKWTDSTHAIKPSSFRSSARGKREANGGKMDLTRMSIECLKCCDDFAGI